MCLPFPGFADALAFVFGLGAGFHAFPPPGQGLGTIRGQVHEAPAFQTQAFQLSALALQ